MPEGGEKRFEATQSRVDRARREGDVAHATELSATVAFAGGLVVALGSVTAIAAHAQKAFRVAADGGIANHELASIVALGCASAAGAAISACALTVGINGSLRLRPLAFNLTRIDPGQGLKRMLSRESASTFARSVAAFVCAALFAVPACIAAFVHAFGGTASAASAARWGATQAVAGACLTGLAFGLVDFAASFAQWRKRLRMSHEEIRRDQKEQDGDPHQRGRRRAFHRRLSRGAMARVKDAAFVVINPRHLAIAMAYRPPQEPVPRVLVRAADEAAARVREIAKAHRIPLVENVPLARALYASVDAGSVVPPEFYLALAAIVATFAAEGTLTE